MENRPRRPFMQRNTNPTWSESPSNPFNSSPTSCERSLEPCGNTPERKRNTIKCSRILTRVDWSLPAFSIALNVDARNNVARCLSVDDAVATLSCFRAYAASCRVSSQENQENATIQANLLKQRSTSTDNVSSITRSKRVSSTLDWWLW